VVFSGAVRLSRSGDIWDPLPRLSLSLYLSQWTCGRPPVLLMTATAPPAERSFLKSAFLLRKLQYIQVHTRCVCAVISVIFSVLVFASKSIYRYPGTRYRYSNTVLKIAWKKRPKKLNSRQIRKSSSANIARWTPNSTERELV